MNIWKRDQGWSEYSFGFVHLRYDGSGFFAGKQAAEGTPVLRDDGNEFTSDSVNIFSIYKAIHKARAAVVPSGRGSN